MLLQLPWEVLILVMEMLPKDALLQMRRVSKTTQGIVKEYVTDGTSKFTQDIDEFRESLPKSLFRRLTKSAFFRNFETRTGKHLFIHKCLSWVSRGPQGPYKPYWHYITEYLAPKSILQNKYGMSDNEYREYCDTQWAKVDSSYREAVKYDGRLKNVFETIEKGLGMNHLGGKRKHRRRPVLETAVVKENDPAVEEMDWEDEYGKWF